MAKDFAGQNGDGGAEVQETSLPAQLPAEQEAYSGAVTVLSRKFETSAPSRALTPAERRQRQLAPIKSGLYVRAPNGRQIRDKKVRRLVSKMHDVMPWLAPSDRPACRAWAELEILSSHVFADLVQRGLTDEAGDPRRLVSEYRGLRRLQLDYEKELGMTPSARAAIGVKAAALQTPAEWLARADAQQED